MLNKLYDSVLVYSLRKVILYLNFDNVFLVFELKEVSK